MAKSKQEISSVENIAQRGNVATSGEVYLEPHTKAVVDGVWNCEGRTVLADTEEQAKELYQRLFNAQPAFCEPSNVIPSRDEKVVHLRVIEGHPLPIPFFGRRS